MNKSIALLKTTGTVMRKLVRYSILSSILILLTLSIALSTSFAAEDMNTKKTGLRQPTSTELDWMDKNFKKAENIKLNNIGKQRIMEKLKKNKSLKNIKSMKNSGDVLERAEKTISVPIGQEIQSTLSTSVSSNEVISTDELIGSLPDSVDNSKLKYFPPIRSQGGIGSCASFSSTYYQFTHMNALARNWDAKNLDDSTRFSPKWTYNMVNRGYDGGSWFSDSYNVLLRNGGATWSDFPYDSDYLAWSTDAKVWRNAVNYRIDKMGSVDNLNTENGLNDLKLLLNDGYVLVFATYIYSWQYTTIKDDPSITSDDNYVGKQICYIVNGSSGGHGMTIVGYDDNIWMDLNNNNVVESGEKGALRIANSWGTSWQDGGFTWLSYNAVRNGSCWYNQAYWITAKSSYSPKLLAEITVNTKERNRIGPNLGFSDTVQTSPSKTWYPAALYYKGGPYAFNGTTTACDGSFVLDYTNLLNENGLDINNERRYYLNINDNTPGNPTILKSFKLINPQNNDIVASLDAFPMSVDSGLINSSVDYESDESNTVLIAVTIDPANKNIIGLNTSGGPVKVMGVFSDGKSVDVTSKADYNSTNSNIAYVKDGVLYSGNTIGTATITSSYAGKTATCTVSVSSYSDTTPPVVTVNPISGSTIAPGSKVMVSANDPSGISYIYYKWNTDSTWLNTSTNTVAVTAPSAEGSNTFELQVRAFDKYNNITEAKYSYIVKGKTLKDISVSPTSTIIKGTNASGETIKITALYSDGTTLDVTDSASFRSSNSNIAYVKGGVFYSGSTIGTATITVSYENKTATCTVQVFIPVEGIRLDKTSIDLGVGGTTILTSTVIPGDATNNRVTWSSSNTTVATVAPDSTSIHSASVKALSAGTATITVTSEDGKKTASCTVTVGSPVELTSISITPTSLTIERLNEFGSNAIITAHYSDGKTSDVTTNTTFTSSNSSIAYYANKAIYSGSTTGTATITATYEDRTAACAVTVKQPLKLTSIKIEPSSMTIEGIDKMGGTLKVIATYSDGTSEDVTKLTRFRTSNSHVAYVINDTVYSKKKHGTAVITASYKGKSDKCTVNVVRPALSSISISPNTESVDRTNKYIRRLTVTATYADGTTSDVTTSTSYTSSDRNIAYVSNSKYLYSGSTTGTATITATYEGKTAACTVTVK